MQTRMTQTKGENRRSLRKEREGPILNSELAQNRHRVSFVTAPTDLTPGPGQRNRSCCLWRVSSSTEEGTKARRG